MKLRFRILEPSNTGAPDYTICGQAAASVNFSGLALKITVNGVVVVDEADLSSPSFPASVDAGGITVDQISIENSEYITLSIGLANSWDSTNVKIEASKTGFIGYTETFKVFGYDLGNNPNQNNPSGDPINYNPDFTLYLLNETNNVVSGKQTKAFASFIAYRHPFTDEIFVYVSNGGTYQSYEYIVNRTPEVTVLETRYGIIINPLSESYKITVKLIDNTTVVSECTSTFVSVPVIDVKADFSASIDTQQTGIIAAGDLGSSLGDPQCFTNQTTNTAKTAIDMDAMTQIYMDDVEEYPYQTMRLLYGLYDSDGILVSYKSIDLDISSYPYTYDMNDAANQFAFVIANPGDYVLKVVVAGVISGVQHIIECFENILIHSDNFYTITENTDCGKYTITNKSFEDLTLKVYEMDDTKSFVEIDSIVVEALSTHDYLHATDNIYKYSILRTLTENNVYGVNPPDEDYEFSFIVASYCNLKSCLFEYIKKLACNTKTCDCNYKDYYNFNALVINALNYFGQLNNEYLKNYLYTAITPNKLLELYDIKEQLDRTQEYCDECTLFNTDCGCS